MLAMVAIFTLFPGAIETVNARGKLHKDVKDCRLYLIEQRLLPAEERHVPYDDSPSVAKAIKNWSSAARPTPASRRPFGMALAAR